MAEFLFISSLGETVTFTQLSDTFMVVRKLLALAQLLDYTENDRKSCTILENYFKSVFISTNYK